MPIQAIQPQRLYQRVAAQIAELVRAGHWEPGERLPSERVLAEQLNVSRPTVREAMIGLELAGLVEVRTGSGIYVTASQPSPSIMLTAERDVGPSPFELIAARRILEGETAALAAANAGPKDLASLAQAVEVMDKQIDDGVQTLSHDQDGDLLFHQRIAAINSNATLESLITQLWEGMRQPLFHRLSARARLSGNARRAVAEHREVLIAIQAGDADGARGAMHRHLDNVRDILLQECPARTRSGDE